ncbi:hypothetical protein JB92DRAFT_2870741 [Gautieria morchelliformis]|nr:hypothetical protein JB92DRAFT_2870741 [Gautieria morchelliformis]
MEHYRLPSLETLGLLHPHPIDFEEDRDLFTQPIRLAPLGLGPVTLVAPIPLLHPALLQPFPAFPQPFPAFPQHPFLPPLPLPPLHIPALPPPPPPATPTPSSPQGDRASSPPFASQTDRDRRRKGKAKARFKSEELPGRRLSRGGSRPHKNQEHFTSMDPQPDLGAGSSRMLRVSARDRSESRRASERRGAKGRGADEDTSGDAVQGEGAGRGIRLRKLREYTFPLGPKGRPTVWKCNW